MVSVANETTAQGIAFWAQLSGGAIAIVSALLAALSQHFLGKSARQHERLLAKENREHERLMATEARDHEVSSSRVGHALEKLELLYEEVERYQRMISKDAVSTLRLIRSREPISEQTADWPPNRMFMLLGIYAPSIDSKPFDDSFEKLKEEFFEMVRDPNNVDKQGTYWDASREVLKTLVQIKEAVALLAAPIAAPPGRQS